MLIWLFWKPRLVWGALILLVLGIFMPLWLSLLLPETAMLAKPAVGISLGGLLLQVGGIGMVAEGIRRTRVQFRQPSLIEMLKIWFQACPLPRRHMVTSSHHINFGLSTEVSAQGHRVPDESMSCIERIRGLERRMDSAEQNFIKLRTTTADLTNSLAEERSERSAEDARIDEQLVAANTGGLQISAIGALWLCVGVIMTSIPHLLAYCI